MRADRRTFPRLALAALILGLLFSPAFAVEPDEVLADPQLEARARSLSRDLRCVVCQNQSIDDSDAPLARDLRLLVRARLKSGDSDREVKAFLVARYGDYVLLRPRLGWATFVLWAAPTLVLLGGGAWVLRLWGGQRRRRPESRQLFAPPSESGPDPLSPEEEARVIALLEASRPAHSAQTVDPA